MIDYAVKASQLNEAFERYMRNPEEEQDNLCELLYPYLRGVVGTLIKEKDYLDKEAVEDLVQDIMATLFDKVFESFKGDAKFSTFCFAIAKNKANTYIKKRNRARMENIDDIYELEVQGAFCKSAIDIYKDPQLVYVIQETRLEMLNMFRKYIGYIMDSEEKPYKVVSVCFSLILFHKYNPKSTMLGSPNWAYTCLKNMTVNSGATVFKDELNAWFENVHFKWGYAQLLAREARENGMVIGEMVFGYNFTTKDFENWSVRMRKNIKHNLIVKEVQNYESGTSFELGL